MFKSKFKSFILSFSHISIHFFLILRVPNIIIGKRKRNVRERSIECELEKISLNSSPETGGATNLSSACCSDASLIVGHLNSDSMDLDMKQM